MCWASTPNLGQMPRMTDAGTLTWRLCWEPTDPRNSPYCLRLLLLPIHMAWQPPLSHPSSTSTSRSNASGQLLLLLPLIIPPRVPRASAAPKFGCKIMRCCRRVATQSGTISPSSSSTSNSQLAMSVIYLSARTVTRYQENLSQSLPNGSQVIYLTTQFATLSHSWLGTMSCVMSPVSIRQGILKPLYQLWPPCWNSKRWVRNTPGSSINCSP
jgi:hypothetical protein